MFFDIAIVLQAARPRTITVSTKEIIPMTFAVLSVDFR